MCYKILHIPSGTYLKHRCGNYLTCKDKTEANYYISILVKYTIMESFDRWIFSKHNDEITNGTHLKAEFEIIEVPDV
jgi:hypothetical protein